MIQILIFVDDHFFTSITCGSIESFLVERHLILLTKEDQYITSFSPNNIECLSLGYNEIMGREEIILKMKKWY